MRQQSSIIELQTTIVTTSIFRKDYKRIKKRGYDLDLLEVVLDTLLCEKPLSSQYKDHALTGNYIGFRECHIWAPHTLCFLTCTF